MVSTVNHSELLDGCKKCLIERDRWMSSPPTPGSGAFHVSHDGHVDYIPESELYRSSLTDKSETNPEELHRDGGKHD